MSRYDRSYDYGLRGADDVARRREPLPRPRGPYDAPFPGRGERRAEPRTNRITARYNADYVYGGRGEDDYPRNRNMYTGDRPYRIGDDRYYRRPYSTIGGTRTYRGASEPIGYDRDLDRYDRDLRR